MSKAHKKHKKDICERCGQCCRVKLYDPKFDVWVALSQYCDHFEWIEGEKGKKFGNCKIYDTRKNGQIVMPGVKCLSAEIEVEARLMPDACPYSKKVPGYKSRVMNFE